MTHLTKFSLRDYQERCINDILDYIKNKKKSKSVAVLPCGAGKSLIIAKLCEILNEEILVIQPSKELLRQNYAKFKSFGGVAAIFSASLGEKNLGNITFVTPRSISGKNSILKTMKTRFVIIDEADDSTKTDGAINKIIKTLKPDHVIGLTATPINLHTTLEKGTVMKMINSYSKNLFNDICHVTQVRELTDKGYWSKMVVEQEDGDESKLELNNAGTDFKIESIINYYEDSDLHDRILSKFEEGLRRGKKRTLIFVPTIEEANNLHFSDKRIKVVSSLTESKERDYIVNSFINGTIQAVACVNTLGVGFDSPLLDHIIMARPTNSYRIYYQFYGRGVRIHEDKTDCLLTDLSGNFKKFGRPEDMTYEYIKGFGWGMFLGEYLMTDINLRSERFITKSNILEKYTSSTETTIPFKKKSSDDVFWFGKYKGKKVSEVPISYLDWLMYRSSFTWDTEGKYKTKVNKFLGQVRERLKKEAFEQIKESPETKTVEKVNISGWFK